MEPIAQEHEEAQLERRRRSELAHRFARRCGRVRAGADHGSHRRRQRQRQPQRKEEQPPRHRIQVAVVVERGKHKGEAEQHHKQRAARHEPRCDVDRRRRGGRLHGADRACEAMSLLVEMQHV